MPPSDRHTHSLTFRYKYKYKYKKKYKYRYKHNTIISLHPEYFHTCIILATFWSPTCPLTNFNILTLLLTSLN